MNAVIVEDELTALRRLRRLLSESGVEVIGEASDGETAVDQIRNLHPDVVFLDIEMPGLDGFGVVRAVGVEEMPPVAFVTAFSEYAVDAFAVRALDYLLKPFDRERLEATLERVFEARPAAGSRVDRMASLMERLSTSLDQATSTMIPEHSSPERLLIKRNGHVQFVEVAHIDWIESEGNYVTIHAGRDTWTIRRKIGDLEAQLDPRRFVRIHRSAIVNTLAVSDMVPWFSGGYLVRLKDREELKLSRTYAARLFEAVGDRF